MGQVYNEYGARQTVIAELQRSSVDEKSCRSEQFEAKNVAPRIAAWLRWRTAFFCSRLCMIRFGFDTGGTEPNYLANRNAIPKPIPVRRIFSGRQCGVLNREILGIQPWSIGKQ